MDMVKSPVRFLIVLPAFCILWMSLNGDNAGNAGNNNEVKTATEDSSSQQACSDVLYRLLEEGIYNRSPFQRYGALCLDSNEALTISEWTRSMIQQDSNCRLGLTNALRSSSYSAFFFETKGVTTQDPSHQQNFEFVLVDAPHLKSFAETNASPRSFTEHFSKCQGAFACSFLNLGGDAKLVAPNPGNEDDAVTYSHLAAFVRTAPVAQIDELWKLVAMEYVKSIHSDHAVWLSTDGTGVPWLHVRLDSIPKYYSYGPFIGK